MKKKITKNYVNKHGLDVRYFHLRLDRIHGYYNGIAEELLK